MLQFLGGGKGWGTGDGDSERKGGGDGILFLLTRNGLLDFGRGHYYRRGGIVSASSKEFDVSCRTKYGSTMTSL